MKYDIVEDNIKIGNKIIYSIDIDILDIIHSLEEENQSLKKQLEENKDKINWYENFEINKTIDKLRIKHNNQQKEFIEYLENCINELKKESMNKLQNTINLGIVDITKEILSKYKSIIGE